MNAQAINSDEVEDDDEYEEEEKLLEVIWSTYRVYAKSYLVVGLALRTVGNTDTVPEV